MKKSEPSRPQCCGELTPEQLEMLLLSECSRSDITHLTAIYAEAEMYLHKYWYNFKDRSQNVFT